MHKFKYLVNQYEIMKTIGISKNIRIMIEENSMEGENINDTLSRLLEDVDDLPPYQPKRPQRTNITLSEENFSKLNSLKADKESFNSVLERLISEKGNTD